MTAHDYDVDPGTGCWLWQRLIHRTGYGRVQRDGRGGGHTMAHRWYYEQHIGPLPDGMELDHLCRNRACVNPAHLEPVTRTENVRRGAHTQLTPEQVREIRSASGTQASIAAIYDVSETTVRMIRNGQRWQTLA